MSSINDESAPAAVVEIEDLPIATKRHSAAHLMAYAIQNLYPGTQFGIGPDIDNGFYYDVILPGGMAVTPEIMKAIQKEMMKLRKQKKMEFEKTTLPIDDAIAQMQARNQVFKVELLQSIKQKGTTKLDESLLADLGDVEGQEVTEVTFFKLGDFVDLCRGPHVAKLGQIPPFKLFKSSAVYWRSDAKNPSMQRIYALCYNSKEEVQAEESRIEEQKRRDHRTLAKKHNLYFIESEAIGPGLPLWEPAGAMLREELEYLGKVEERKDGYDIISTPEITHERLFKQSGHLPYYADDMYNPIEIEDEKYYLRPMNCPFHHHVFMHKPHSYRDLPIRFAEFGKVFRNEMSGALSGLMRARGFTQNDAHIYCRESQAKEMIIEVIKLHERYYQLFDIKDYYIRFSLADTDGDKFVEDKSGWDTATAILKEALDDSKIKYTTEEGEAAFYGPKMDFQIKSVIGTEYTISTIQLDFLATGNFDLTYVDEHGTDQPVYVIHRAPLGSHERFIAFLIEHYEAKFPTWISPTHATVLPVSDKHLTYASKVTDYLNSSKVNNATNSLRIKLDSSNETIPKKVRTATKTKVPYIIVVGDQEIADNTVTVRFRSGEQHTMSVEAFKQRLAHEINNRVELGEALEFKDERVLSFEEFQETTK